MLLDYIHLGDGETVNGETCPACRGGLNGDASLSVSNRDGTLLWICYRDTCGFRGSSGNTQGGTVPRTKAVPTRGAVGRWIAREASAIPQQAADDLLARYGITEVLASRGGFGWDSESDRLVMPVRDAQGSELGVMLRALDGRKPKVISHTEQGATAWYTNHTAPGVIIVEDQLSALRASIYLTSVALLGTNLSDERVAEIRKAGHRPVYLALDNDAIASAVKYVVKYRSTLPMQLVRLDKDIKDHDNHELDSLMEAYGISRQS